MTEDIPTPTRTCRACRASLPLTAYAGGAKTCNVCLDPDPVYQVGDLTRYQRADDLDRWCADADAELNEARAATLRRIDVLDRDVREAVRDAIAATNSPFWASFFGAFALSCWNTARGLGGEPEMRYGERPDAREAPFGSVAAALRFVIMNERDIGLGSCAPRDDVDEHDPNFVRVRENIKRLAEDARDARRALTPRDARGRPIGPMGSFMPVKATRASSARAQGEDAAIGRVDVQRAIAASGIGPADLALLAAVHVGEERKRPRKQGGGMELVTVKPGELARRLSHDAKTRRASLGMAEGQAITAQAIGRRIGRARKALAEALVARGLIPAEKPRRGKRPQEPAKATAATIGGDAWI